MRRPTHSLPLLALTLAVAAACAPPEPASRAAQQARQVRTTLGASPTCDTVPDMQPTSPIVVIDDVDVDADTFTWAPEPVVQPVGSGFLGWRMAEQPSDYGWKVEFTKDGSPLPDTVYFDSAGKLNGGVVSEDSECRHYDYTITVWPRSDPSNTVTIDPGGDIIPW